MLTHKMIYDWFCQWCGHRLRSSHPQTAPLANFAGIFDVAEHQVSAAPEPERTIHGSVIGYRAWRIVNWQLCGTAANRAWMPGVNEATCGMGEGSTGLSFGNGHAAPAVGCHCGLTALARFTSHDRHWPAENVTGAIEAWGDDTARVEVAQPGDVADATGVHEREDEPAPSGGFILHGTGFRARYGKVVLLAVDDEWRTPKKAAVRALATEHGADVCRTDHLEDAAKEHGQLVPDEMLEWAGNGTPASDNFAAAMQHFAQSMQQMKAAYYWGITRSAGSGSPFSVSLGPGAIPPARPGPARTRSTKLKGIRETLRYPGPPSHGKYRRGDLVKDPAGMVWECVKGGNPGTWQPEE